MRPSESLARLKKLAELRELAREEHAWREQRRREQQELARRLEAKNARRIAALRDEYGIELEGGTPLGWQSWTLDAPTGARFQTMAGVPARTIDGDVVDASQFGASFTSAYGMDLDELVDQSRMVFAPIRSTLARLMLFVIAEEPCCISAWPIIHEAWVHLQREAAHD